MKYEGGNSTPVGSEKFRSKKSRVLRFEITSHTDQKIENDWRKRAECRFSDPELFHIIGDENSKPARAQIVEARSVCAECPVRRECLDWAIRTQDEYSIAGGKTPNERKSLLRESIPSQRKRGA